jgi:outer membrane protein OmpA-like peptidoglycan-associated protein
LGVDPIVKNFIRPRFLFFVIFLGCFMQLRAQDNFTLYFMNSINQSSYTNTSTRPINNINFGIPALSSIYFGLSNSSIKYSDLIYKRSDDSLVFDMDNALKLMDENNYLTSNFRIDIISFGFRLKKNYINLSVTERFDLRFRYPKDFVDFVWRGNGPSLGETLNFNFGMEFSHFREYGFHYIRDINEKFTAGFKYKYLYGMENIHTERSNVTLTTNPNNYDLTATSDVLIQTAGIGAGSLRNFNFLDYVWRKENRGYSLDLGLTYRHDEKLSVAASVIDIGGINWNSQVKNYQSANPSASYTYTGINIRDLVNDSNTVNDAFNITMDSIRSSFRIDTANTPYRTRLKTHFYVGATYQLNETFTPGILFHGMRIDDKFKPSATVSINMHLLRNLHTTLSYTAFNRSYNNVGLGISYNAWGGSQFYIVSDNIVGMIFPQNAKLTNIRVGINLRFGADPYLDDDDGDGVLNHEDKCPFVPGPAEFKGCPDRDGDKVPDFEDQCPDEYGSPKFMGCPDRDGDGVIDKFDKCPDTPGIPRFKGCPDRDNDGIEDSEDDCPDEPGVAEFKGCPDTDGDGIPDKKDKCPDKFGTADNQGCPTDRDEDGVPDAEDDCPDEPGPAINKGCPDKDSDNDGILDRLDDCPLTPGSIENKGCPEPSPEEKMILDQAKDELEFVLGKDEIIPSSIEALEKLARLLNQKPDYNIKITAHTATEGTPSFDLSLSKDRGEAVRELLNNRGIANERIKVEGKGSTEPIADNATEYGRKKNSRIEFTLLFK